MVRLRFPVPVEQRWKEMELPQQNNKTIDDMW